MTRRPASWSTMFVANFAKFESHVDGSVRDAPPV
jgi:hypothetical protein